MLVNSATLPLESCEIMYFFFSRVSPATLSGQGSGDASPSSGDAGRRRSVPRFELRDQFFQRPPVQRVQDLIAAFGMLAHLVHRGRINRAPAVDQRSPVGLDAEVPTIW